MDECKPLAGGLVAAKAAKKWVGVGVEAPCDACKLWCAATKKCSGCKAVRYCGAMCQAARPNPKP
jgi:hypothetical protein